MSHHQFYILDVFAEKKYSGNQLAVFRDAGGLSNQEMQQIANEMHFSETTFILSEKPRNSGWDVRIFTPEAELPFAGHPTLGTAYVLQQKLICDQVEEVVLNLKVGRIPVSFNYSDGRPDQLWMRQMPPQFGRIFTVAQLAPVLSLSESDFDARFPIEESSTGAGAIIIPLKTLTAVKTAMIHRQNFFAFIRDIPSKVPLIFCTETVDKANQLHVRVFADEYGIPEDPATGSANGCLAGWLVKHRYFGGDIIDIRVEQGLEMGRPSLLHLRAARKGDSIEVHVGGKVIMIAEGEFV
jgi:trans-2,3-dihydro-3-hydroxyanthranilate isomerase